jgi:hypothetical protein
VRSKQITLTWIVLSAILAYSSTTDAKTKKSQHDKARDARLELERKEQIRQERRTLTHERKTERRITAAGVRQDYRDNSLLTTHPRQWYTKHVMGRFALVKGGPAKLATVRGRVVNVVDSKTVAVAAPPPAATPNVKIPPVTLEFIKAHDMKPGSIVALPNAVRAGTREYPWKDSGTVSVKAYKEALGLTYAEFRTLLANGHAFPL